MSEDGRVEVKIEGDINFNLIPARLRTTALEMRHFAEKASSQGRWKTWGMSVMADVRGDSNADTAELVAVGATPEKDRPSLRTWNSEHIARWDPTTALTIAEFMEWVADAREAIDAVSSTPGQGTEMFLTAERHAMAMMDAVTKGRG